MRKISVILACLMLLLTGCSSADITVSTPRSPLAELPPVDYLVLVNKEHEIPDNWESQIALISDYDPWGDEVKIEKETCEQFNALERALLEEGVDIRLDSVYRSREDQQATWDYFKKERGEDYCKQYVAAPGFSEHQTGLAVDVCMMVDGEPDDDNDHMLASTELFEKVHALMPEYGFILRYPKGKEDITGYSYEPWHLRYVGSPEVARKIAASDLTLEEYLSSP